MEKILCATDGSEPSRKAELWAVKQAKLGAEVSFIYVSGVDPDDATGTVGDVIILEAVEAKEHEVLRHCEELCRDNGIENIRTIIHEAHNIPFAIVEYGETCGFDHIVIGSRGRSRISDILLGSVAHDVIRYAHCAVTVLR